MKTMLACVAVLAVLASSAVAAERYDRKLEEAAKARVAEKIGDMRGGFDYGAGAVFVQPDAIMKRDAAPMPRPTQESGIRGGQGTLTLAIDRKFSDHIC